MAPTFQEIRSLLNQVALNQIKTDAQLAKTSTETDMRFKETDKKINKATGLITTLWGKLVESLVEGDLLNLLQAKGIRVHDTVQRHKGRYKNEHYEFDIIAHNDTQTVFVEVKTSLGVEDVKHFLNKLENVKKWLPMYKAKSILGAIAFLKADAEADTYAMKQGLYVIRATGNSARIINDKKFKAKEF